MWYKTAAEKYGASGIKGDHGERLYSAFANKKYDVVHWNQSDKIDQAAGADFTINMHGWKRSYTVDVKANYKNGVFFVDNKPSGWLWAKKKTSDIIVHLDVVTGDLLQYYRKDMKSLMELRDADSNWLVLKRDTDTDIASFINRDNIHKY